MIARYVRLWLTMLLLASAISVSSAEGDERVGRLAEQVRHDIAAIRALDERIADAPEHAREPLTFRRDERSLRLLVLFDQLTRSAAALPAEDATRKEVEQLMGTELAGIGDAIMARVDALGERIATLKNMLADVSGADRVHLEAYLQSSEQLRMDFYEALVKLLEARRALGLVDDEFVGKLLPILYLQAEATVGRLEYNGGAMRELNERLAADSGNADVAATRTEVARQQRLDIDYLSRMVALLDRLGEESDDYKAVLVRQGQGLSVSALDAGVIRNLLQSAWETTHESLVNSAPDVVFDILLFTLIVLAFRWLSNLVKRAVRAACERPGVDMSQLLRDVLVSVCGGVVMVTGVLVALAQVGISLGPMLAGLGVAGFVIGFALQDTLANFAAGGMILIYRPYDVDDFVEVAGASGLVKKMSLVSTTITTFDNQTLVVPNSKIWGDVIKNVTAQKVRRVDLVFGIGYGDDIEKAERVLADIVGEHEKILRKPAPVIKLHELADSSVNFVVRPWVKTEDYWDVYWDLTREVKQRFDREGITIPFPQRDMHVYHQGQA
jgi:small conductance mechanosensitive channel